MGVTPGRLAQIERGEAVTIDATARYINALGGVRSGTDLAVPLVPSRLAPMHPELASPCSSSRSWPVHLLSLAAFERQDCEARFLGCPALVGESCHGGTCNDCLCEMVCAVRVRPALVRADVQ